MLAALTIRPSRRPVLLAAAVLALAIGGCGNKQDVVTRGDNEGVYVETGDLTYQVQLSRPLNPKSVEDRAYVSGLPETETPLRADETWFAVFMRVFNETGKPHQAAQSFEITDTQGVVYKPVGLASSNPFAYRPALIPAKADLPLANSPASELPTGGALLLFRVTLESLQNRPLELKIKPLVPPSAEAVVTLDV
jgi:hypothetical protein